MPIIDLSHPLATGMPVYPGDPEVAISEALNVRADGVAVASLRLGSHSGTHLDAPSHSIAGGRTVDEIPLEMLVGQARMLRVRVAPGAGIGAAQLTQSLPKQLPAIVCISTGWDHHFGSEAALRHPHVTLELAMLLWQRGARVLGVDTLSPDPTCAEEGAAMPVHEFWLGGDGVIVENLTGLQRVPDEVQLSLLPLRLAGVDGSPIRAIAIVP